MKKLKLDIVGLSYSQTQSGAYALVLGEINGNRRLPIIIGSFEAQAIAVEIEKMTPSRPLTHDLFKSFADTFDISVDEVLIYNLVDGIFFAKLICSQGNQTHEIDARTSDAVALAVRFECPIYTYDFIMAAAGIVIESNDFAFLENMSSASTSESEISKPKQEFQKPKEVSPYASLTMEQLESTLEKAIANEQYEVAAKIRDEIEKRKS
ncbi:MULTISPECIES: bifunctional nuclease family protein [Sphingobacterium]|jgi:bifunctional DNase/RNase|uniref:Bifunctional nuclease family protein n=1 Tax=Sphingobacterium litopenaei TaxID=2763500 RepID=A0ABR7YEI0_9SPHI|nr:MULTISPECIES: bifunctional nuclease family protein [Sphingobacterium]MBD1429719.1 bifunctional nuclease family protein [Sphingobacterium litopenaei]NGM74433.1 bifunctional nuclease family protein [Sphingobacterium sp. SGL-16]